MKDEHRALIESADIVSFDVFDTLLARNSIEPRDVFVVTQELFNEDSRYTFNGNFCQERIQAELVARKIYRDQVDVTLEQIYSSLQTEFGYDKEFCDQLMAYEKKAEQKMMTRDLSTAELYDYAKSLKKNIVIVSDMYLSEEDIAQLLRDNGVDGWSEMIVSSDKGVSKATGSSFSYLKSKYKNKTIVHVGDNIHSDVSWPQKFGINTIHIHTNAEDASFEIDKRARGLYGGNRYRFTKDAEQISPTSVQFNILSGMLINYIFDKKVSLDQAFGYGVFGPLLLSLVQWIQSRVKVDGYDKLYFLARDGAIMQAAYELYYGERATPHSYMLGSRRLLRFPSMDESNFNVNWMFGLNAVSVSQTLKQCGLKPTDKRVIAALDTVGLKVDDSTEMGESADRLKAALNLLKDDILEKAAKEREQLLGYYSQIGIDNATRPVIIDIGWNGSMQRSISHLLGRGVDGLYFGIHDTEDARSMGSAMQGYFDTRLTDSSHYFQFFVEGGVLILESLLTNPAQGSLIELQKKRDGTFVGVEAEHDLSAEQRERLETIHDSALKFIEDFKALELPKSLATINRDNAIRPFEWIVRQPNEEMAQMFGKILYDEVINAVPNYIGHPLHQPSSYRGKKGAKALRDEYDRANWKEGFVKNCELLGIKPPQQ